jgi:tripartite-type tricarboxylate transporter receptor subunit TctC
MFRQSILMLIVGAVALAGSLPFVAVARAEYPDRPITLIVPWGAGGGTDAAARIIAAVLKDELGQPVNVVNRTGGSGVVGHQAIADAEPDGYTLGFATGEINMMHWEGLTDLTYKAFTPIALMNLDPAALQVSAASDYKTAQDLVDAIKASPGELKASGTGQGGSWHLAIAGMLNAAGIKPNAVPWVPSNGAAEGLQDLVAGGVDIVPCSLPEARAMIDAGRVRSLAVMSDHRADVMPEVPTLKEAIGLDWTLGDWRGVVGPKGLPDEAVKVLVPAMQKVYESDQYRDFMKKRGYGIKWAGGEDFGDFMAKEDDVFGEIVQAVGLARK